MNPLNTYDKRLAVWSVMDQDNDIFQMVAWFFKSIPYDDSVHPFMEHRQVCAFRSDIAPYTPISRECMLNLQNKYGNMFNWAHSPTSAMYRRAAYRPDAWKVFREYLEKTWGNYLPKDLVPVSTNLLVSDYLLYKGLFNLYKDFTNAAHDEKLLSRYDFVFTPPKLPACYAGVGK